MPDAWKLIPGFGDCPIYEADVKRVQIPPRTWTACAPGCLVAPANGLPTDTGTYWGSATGAFLRGEIFVRLVSGSPAYQLAYVWRLSDGHVVAAGLKRGSGPCGVLGWSRAAPQILPFLYYSDRGDHVATSRLDGSPLTWSPIVRGLPVHQSVFSNDLGWGATFSDGSVRFQSPVDAPQMTIIEQSAINNRAAARRDLIVWTSAVAHSVDVLKGYRPSEQVKVVVSGPKNVITVALSDTAMVWIAASGPRVFDGTSEYAEFSWSDWPENLSVVQPRGTVPVPGTDNAGLRTLQTGGDYAATTGCVGTQCRLLVLRLSTGRLWTVPHRPNAAFSDILAVSDGEILLAETDDGAAPNTIQRLIRLEVARLDELQAAW